MWIFEIPVVYDLLVFVRFIDSESVGKNGVAA
jgi:hypothetical protein